jgi:hypothetical protein
VTDGVSSRTSVRRPSGHGAGRAVNARLRQRLLLFAAAAASCSGSLCDATRHKEKPRSVGASSNAFQRGTSAPQSGPGQVNLHGFARSVTRSFGRKTNRLGGRGENLRREPKAAQGLFVVALPLPVDAIKKFVRFFPQPHVLNA